MRFEKAWVKVKGNFFGGVTSEIGIHELTCLPVLHYWTFDIYVSEAMRNEMWQKLLDGE